MRKKETKRYHTDEWLEREEEVQEGGKEYLKKQKRGVSE